MTDILLIQPPIRDFYLTVKRTIPYGLACIAAVLIEEGYSVRILDGLATAKSRFLKLPAEMRYLKGFYGSRRDFSPLALFSQYRHFGNSFDHLGRTAARLNPFLIGISALFTPYAQAALDTAEAVRRHLPDCKIVIGGHHATAMPREIIRHPAVDFVLRGEGEVSLPRLAQALRNDEDPRHVPGIVFAEEDGRLHISPPAWMKALESYPAPAMDLIKQRYYRRGAAAATVVVTSRGCPFRCSYCCIGGELHAGLRRRPIGAVLEEIRTAVLEHKAAFIDFEDEHLSSDRGWFQTLLNRITADFGDKSLELRAMNGLFPPSLDADIVESMKRAGFKTLNLSLGSTDTDQLRRFNRPDVRGAFDQVLEWCRRYDLSAVGYVIAGAPFQPPESSVRDLLYLASRRVLAGLSVFYPAPRSRDYHTCRKRDLLPTALSLMRSSALPISHTTTRLEVVTLMRLARIVNFIKQLMDSGRPLPEAAPYSEKKRLDPDNRLEAGSNLLSWFLHDGQIRGVDAEGIPFDHYIDTQLTRRFLAGLAQIRIRGYLSG